MAWRGRMNRASGSTSMQMRTGMNACRSPRPRTPSSTRRRDLASVIHSVYRLHGSSSRHDLATRQYQPEDFRCKNGQLVETPFVLVVESAANGGSGRDADRGGVRGKQEIAMRRVLRFFLWGLIVVVVLGGALFGYFLYSPTPEVPRLSGKLTRGTIEVGGLKRAYLTYVPRRLTKGAPLVVVMHGSGENGTQMRIWTGYGFERLADEHHFAVVYPTAHEGDWNACGTVGDVSANGPGIDDVGFLTGVVD